MNIETVFVAVIIPDVQSGCEVQSVHVQFQGTGSDGEQNPPSLFCAKIHSKASEAHMRLQQSQLNKSNENLPNFLA